MSEWRPEDGWDSYWDTWRLLPDSRTRRSLNRVDFEAGADAMLAALKEQSVRVDVGVDKGIINLPFHGGSHGFVVFIPDKE